MAVRKKVGSLKRVGWVVGFTLWSVALAAGFHQAMTWEFKPGQAAVSMPHRALHDPRPWLIVALHSQCPCSIATVDNLTSLTIPDRGRLRITFVFTGPDVKHSRLLERAKAIPEANIEFLSEEEVLTRYGARTSGQALIYDRQGKLVFSGGLTEARGVPGEAPGMDAIHDVLDGRKCAAKAPVFGCTLQTAKVKS